MQNEFGIAQRALITILVDNRADLIVKSSKRIKYFTTKPLIAEHGFAALIDLPDANLRILWDAGLTSLAFMENMKRMKIDLKSIQKIAISHGHDDHTAGVSDLLRCMDLKPKAKEWDSEDNMNCLREGTKIRRIPIIAQTAAFRERWFLGKDGKKFGPITPPPQLEWEFLGGEIILSDVPYQLGTGCWTTGMIPRQSFERSGRSDALFYRQGEQFIKDDIEDDQALVVNVKEKGLVIISGCAHSGIINTILHARQISGVEQIWAVLGGFHLANADEQELQQTIAALKGLKPRLVVPSHCTGFQAQCKLAEQMKDVFVPGVVGARYYF